MVKPHQLYMLVCLQITSPRSPKCVSSNNPNLRKGLYISLVRSKLTYCSQLWRPRLMKDIIRLENVQRQASKFMLSDFSSNYTARLISLHILPLMYWLELQDIMFLIKCLKDPPDNIEITSHISFASSATRASSTQFQSFLYCTPLLL